MSKKLCVILMVCLFALFGFLYWLICPALSLRFLDTIILLAVFLIMFIPLLVVLIKGWESDTIFGVLIGTVLSFVAICLFVLIASWNLFHHNTRASQLFNGDMSAIEEVDFTNMITEIDTSQIPIVDYDTAKKLADKKLGEDMSLGSRVKLGNGTIQAVNGEIIWVFPLEHAGFFKWYKNHTTPGYIVVSASNTNKVTYYKDYGIQYSNSSFFSYNLKRYIRNHGCITEGLTEYSFELDEEKNPHWVVTLYKNTILLGTPEAIGVVIVDADTGAIKKYGLDEVPSWVDVVQPEAFIGEQINNWGTLKDGWPNFSDTGKIKKTSGVLTVYNKGECYYFTGMTSIGSDDSVVGFVMVNTRNKKVYLAKISGATEDAAMSAANSLYSDFGYYATEPMPINENGVPTYAVALKSKDSGLITAYAMVNVNDYSISAKGESLNEASRAYKKKLSTAGISYAATDTAYGYQLSGNIFRISSEIQDGETYYTFIIAGEENKIFVAGYTLSVELAITRDGDIVSISYIDDGKDYYNVTDFDNLAFATAALSDNQTKREQLDEGVGVYEDDNKNLVIDVDPIEAQELWESLSDEEKAELINGYTGNNN